MDNPEKTEGAIKRNCQHWVQKTQGEDKQHRQLKKMSNTLVLIYSGYFNVDTNIKDWSSYIVDILMLIQTLKIGPHI